MTLTHRDHCRAGQHWCPAHRRLAGAGQVRSTTTTRGADPGLTADGRPLRRGPVVLWPTTTGCRRSTGLRVVVSDADFPRLSLLPAPRPFPRDHRRHRDRRLTGAGLWSGGQVAVDGTTLFTRTWEA